MTLAAFVADLPWEDGEIAVWLSAGRAPHSVAVILGHPVERVRAVERRMGRVG